MPRFSQRPDDRNRYRRGFSFDLLTHADFMAKDYRDAQKLADLLLQRGFPAVAKKYAFVWAVERSHHPDVLEQVPEDFRIPAATEVLAICRAYDLQVARVCAALAGPGPALEQLKRTGAARLHCACQSGKRTFLAPGKGVRCGECENEELPLFRGMTPPPKLLSR